MIQFIINLQQYETNVLETRKKKRKRNLHHIGFAVYEVPPHMTRLTPLYVAEHVSSRKKLYSNFNSSSMKLYSKLDSTNRHLSCFFIYSRH